MKLENILTFSFFIIMSILFVECETDDHRVLRRGDPSLQPDREGEAGEAHHQGDPGELRGLEAHGVIESVDREGRVGVPFLEAGVTDLLRGVIYAVGGVEFREQTPSVVGVLRH